MVQLLRLRRQSSAEAGPKHNKTGLMYTRNPQINGIWNAMPVHLRSGIGEQAACSTPWDKVDVRNLSTPSLGILYETTSSTLVISQKLSDDLEFSKSVSYNFWLAWR
jgi:hypothetical protein